MSWSNSKFHRVSDGAVQSELLAELAMERVEWSLVADALSPIQLPADQRRAVRAATLKDSRHPSLR